MSRQAYADFARDVQADEATYANPRSHLRFWTKKMEVWGPCGDFEDLEFVDKENTPGGLSIKVPDNEHWRAYFYGQSRYAVRPITVDLPGYRTLWFTTSFGRIREGRKQWIQVEAVHAMEHLNWIRIWPDWYFPPEFQPSKFATGIGGAVTVCKGLLFGNLIRLQAPLFSIPTGNLFEFGTWNLLRNALWPIIVNPRGTGFSDTSRWAAVSARMDKYLDVAQEVCELNNISITMDLFIYGEDEQPFPEYAHLDRNTLIVNFVEKGPHFSFTGTVIDGLIRTVVEMADDAINWVTYPILGDNGWDDYLQEAAGTLPGKPFALYRTGKYATTGRVEQMTHIPMATRATGGGKSPGWMNDIVVNAGNFVVGWIGLALGIPGLSLGVLTDRLKDTVMAFHSVEDLRLANEAGPWRFKEAFVPSEGTGLSLNTYAAMWSTLWGVRGYQSTAIEVTNGAPYFVGRDVNKGDPIAYELPDGSVEVEHLREIRYSESSSTAGRGRFVLQIGDGRAEQEPGAIALGKFRKLASTLTRVALGG